MKQPITFFQPSDAIRGVYPAIFQYYLEKQTDSVRIDILDADGKLINSFKGDKPEYKPDPSIPRWERRPNPPTTKVGLNQFVWDLRYPGATVFEGMILWGANPRNGPKAPIGKYQVRLSSGAFSKTWSFNIKLNPNLKGVTEADLKETFDLAMKIRDRESEGNQAVIRVRQIRKQIEAGLKETSDPQITAAAKDLLLKLSVIEEDLYQVRNRSSQDPLNFPIKLGNRISAVRRSLETGDAKPTAGTYKVFAELSKDLDAQLAKLESTLKTGLEGLNTQLMNKQMKAIVDMKK
jgi:hypothetical protein